MAHNRCNTGLPHSYRRPDCNSRFQRRHRTRLRPQRSGMRELLRIPFRFRVRLPPHREYNFSIVTMCLFSFFLGTGSGTTNSKARPKTLIPSRESRSPESGLRNKLRHIPETLAGGHCGFPRGEPSPVLESGCSYTTWEIFIWTGFLRRTLLDKGGDSPQSTA